MFLKSIPPVLTSSLNFRPVYSHLSNPTLVSLSCSHSKFNMSKKKKKSLPLPWNLAWEHQFLPIFQIGKLGYHPLSFYFHYFSFPKIYQIWYNLRLSFPSAIPLVLITTICGLQKPPDCSNEAFPSYFSLLFILKPIKYAWKTYILKRHHCWKIFPGSFMHPSVAIRCILKSGNYKVIGKIMKRQYKLGLF